MLFREASAAPVSGGITFHSDSGTDASSNSSASPSGYEWDTYGTHTYTVRGQIVKASTSSVPISVSAQVSGALKAWNTNAISDGASVQTTDGALTSEHSNSLSEILTHDTAAHKLSAHRAVQSHAYYPYKIVSSYKQDATTFDMSANVNISYQRANTYPREGNGSTFTVTWSNTLLSNAVYNRTLDHATVYVESDVAVGGYHIANDGAGCYQRVAQASDGYVLADQSYGQCVLPQGKYICGYELCTGPVISAAGMAPTGRAPVTEKPLLFPHRNNTASAVVRVESNTVPLVRHPLMGRVKLQHLWKV
jgi:hypothetical protein